MSINLLEPGERLLVVHRRLFEGDDNRFFLGEVEAFDAGAVRVTGYSFVRDAVHGAVCRKHELRTKILSLTSGTLLVYVLPRSLNLEQTELHWKDADIRLTDGENFTMNLSEWSRHSQ